MSDTPRLHPSPARIRAAKHDLRNPLGEILGFAEMLLEDIEDQGGRKLQPGLQRIRQESNALLKRINESLDLEALQLDPALPSRLGSLIGDYCGSVIQQANTLVGHCETEPGTPFLDDLRRIADAAGYMRARAPMLLEDVYESGGEYSVQVLSRGCDEPDSGLVGDTVFLRRPAAAKSADSPPLAPRVADSVLQTERATVLVVDDNEANRELLTRRLSRQGHLVAQAANGEHALQLLSQDYFDVVLLDVIMPKLDGHDVLAAMRMDRRLRHIPVIMISGLDDVESLVRCIQAGAEDYLTKPFDPVLLNARIHACLDKKRLRDREAIHLRTIEEQRRRADELLRVILPEAIATELKETDKVRPRRHEQASILWVEVVDFVAACDREDPETITSRLQAMVLAFEDIALSHGLEKIKTSGATFLAAAGLHGPAEEPALPCVQAGLEMIQATLGLTGDWQVRAGVHLGAVMAGVIGRRKYVYDVWGDAVNTAGAIAGLAAPGGLLTSAEVWAQVKPYFDGRSEGLRELPGKGARELFAPDSPYAGDTVFLKRPGSS